MDQQHFKVSLSLATKLLVGGAALLILIILFLNVSAIRLLQKDKVAYIYQTQATEAVLASREFVNTAQRVMNTLRLTLSAFDPQKPFTPGAQAAVQTIVSNQNDTPNVSVYLLEAGASALKSVMPSVRAKGSVPEATGETNELTIDSLREILPDLQGRGYGFMNFSKVGEVPILGIVIADTKLKDSPAGMPVAVAAVPLQEFQKQMPGLNLTIAARSGRVLFDTDPAMFFLKKDVSEDPLFQTAVASPLSTGAREYEVGGRKYVGSFVQPGLDLVVIDRADWDKAMRATYALSEKFIVLGLIAIAAATIMGIFFAKTLTAPINRLYEATKEVAAGNFNVNLPAQGRDEISALTSSFNVMSKQISELIVERMKKIQMENEMMIAATVQQTLIPPPSYLDERIRIHAHYQSAAECGGDWWGFFSVGKKMAFMISDATGHGLPSALITASARSCVSVIHKLAQEGSFGFSPSKMLSYANRVIFDASRGKIMMTFFAGVIDFETMTLTYSNAGQTPPWLFKKADGKYVLKSLVAQGQRLGEAEDCIDFEEKTVQLDPNDVLFIYTDGLLEGQNLAGAQYGKKRARQLVESLVEKGPEELIQAVVKDFSTHNEGKSLDDDLTVAAMLIAPAEGYVQA